METKNVYIVLSSTPYKIGRMIRMVTGNSYNHASISLDENMTQMYSFARRYQNTPLLGGFVEESTSRFSLHGKNSSVMIYKLTVTKEAYDELAERLEKMCQAKEHYLYNHLSVLTVIFRKSIRLRDAYTCVEFCVDILHQLGFQVTPGKYYSIRDLMDLLAPYKFYAGLMPDSADYDSAYHADKPVPHPILSSAKSIVALLPRLKK